MRNGFHEKVFTDSVRKAQEHYGTRQYFERFETEASSFEGLDVTEKEFIESRDGFYMATVNEHGQPYIQFRGGPPGFLKVLDERTLGYADFRGNLQYVSVGNLAANNRAALILMDYARRQRLKLLARVEVSDAKEAVELVAALQMPGYKGKIERAMILRIEAFEWNCPQHITQRFTIGEIRQILAPVYERIEALEEENRGLRALANASALRDTS